MMAHYCLHVKKNIGITMEILSLEEAKKRGYTKVYFSFDCVGDTLLLMSALEYLYLQHGKKLLIGTYYCELIENCEYLDLLDGFYEDTFNINNYEKVVKYGINPIFITGTKFITINSQIRPAWGDNHILINVCNKLGVTLPIQVKTKMFLRKDEISYGKFFKNNQIAITGAGWQKYKTIPFKTLQQVVTLLSKKYNFVQIGHISDPLLDGVLDMRSEGSLRKTASILYNSDVLLCGIGGMMHMARAVNCRAVVGFSYAEPLHLENYICNINVFTKNVSCKRCGENLDFPYLIQCKDNFSCIRDISPVDLCNALEEQLNKKGERLETDVVTPKPTPVTGIEDYLKRFGQIQNKNA